MQERKTALQSAIEELKVLKEALHSSQILLCNTIIDTLISQLPSEKQAFIDFGEFSIKI